VLEPAEKRFKDNPDYFNRRLERLEAYLMVLTEFKNLAITNLRTANFADRTF